MTEPLTVVREWGDFVIAAEDRDADGHEVEPGEWHEVEGVACWLDTSGATGRAFCAHGFWYDRHYWQDALA